MENMALLPEGEFYPKYANITESLFGYGKLNVVKFLGSGMSSQVVLATSPKPPFAAWAVKIISLNNDADKMKRLFHSEVSAMKTFNHRHLMKATYAYEHPTHLFICMDYCPLGSLSDVITNLPLGAVEKYLIQLASAVKHMHDNRYAHCDIKLPNILILAPDHVILTDFGLCRKIPEGVDEIPLSYVGGTLDYSAPETIRDDPHRMVNPMKLDMYSLGLVLKAMIYGYDPENTDQTPARPIMENSVPELLQFCLENLLKVNYRERFSSSQLMETLLTR